MLRVGDCGQAGAPDINPTARQLAPRASALHISFAFLFMSSPSELRFSKKIAEPTDARLKTKAGATTLCPVPEARHRATLHYCGDVSAFVNR